MGLRMIPFFKAKNGRVNTGFGVGVASSGGSGGSGGSSNNKNYSYDEQIIGKWVNGKTLYSRVIEFNSTITGSTQTGETQYDLSSLGVDDVVWVQALYLNDNTTLYNNYFGGSVYSAYSVSGFNRNNKIISVWQGRDYPEKGKKILMYIEYTKED